MAAICGTLDRIEADSQDKRWAHIKAVVSGRTTICVRALIGKQTLIARGVDRVDLSDLHTGEPIEVGYRHSRDGYLEADTIYVQPQRAAVG